MRILFAGDVLIKKNKIHLSDEVQALFDSCDIRICNFEAPIIDEEKDSPIIKTGPAVFQSDSSIGAVKDVGFDLVSLANNHILDYGRKALEKTISALDQNEIGSTGAGFSFEEAYKPYILDDGKTKIAVIACSQGEFGVFKSEEDSVGYAWINHPRMNDLVAQTKKEVDYVYVLAHAGLERIPYPLPEWRIRYKDLIDAGADCIIGGHPHIAQGHEVYNGKYIFYSLGNFFFDLSSGIHQKEADRGLIVISDTANNLAVVEIIPFSIKGNTISVDRSEDMNDALKHRSQILQDKDIYLSKMNEIAEDLWNEYYRGYYNWACRCKTDINKMGLKGISKHLLNRFLNKDTKQNDAIEVDVNETLLLHNIQIESHRWTVERYLYNLNKKQNKF